MDLAKTGALLRQLRKEKHMTQREVASELGLSEKTVSKWETGHGYPDISLLSTLSKLYCVDLAGLLTGRIEENTQQGGNMRNIQFYVCPICGNILTAMGNASITCCTRTLTPCSAAPTDEDHALNIEPVEDELYITSAHPMEKEHTIAFLAFVEGDRITMVRLYPEWSMQVRLPKRRRGTLYWYCTVHGLMKQRI